MTGYSFLEFVRGNKNQFGFPLDLNAIKRLRCNADIQMFRAFSLMVQLCWKNVVFQYMRLFRVATKYLV